MNINKLGKRTLKLFGLFSLVISLIVLPLPITQAARNTDSVAMEENARIYFDPVNITFPLESTLNLMLDSPSDQIGFIRIDFAFDPTQIQLSSEIQPTDLLRVVIQKTSKASANSTGQITIILGLAPGDVAPIGKIQIAQLSFEAATGSNNQFAYIYFIEPYMELVNVNVTDLAFESVPGKITLYSFTDVEKTYWAWQYIERLYSAGVTGGCSTTPLSYCPEGQVTRAQMAVFLEKGVHYPSAYSAPNVAPTFTDTFGHWAEDWIEALRSDGITGGCGTNIYCPESAVTRAQMAVFLLKAKHGKSYTPPSVGSNTGFTDVPTTHWGASWIKQLAAEGITGGCGAGIYCPESPVTRAQMAVFLVKTFNLP